MNIKSKLFILLIGLISIGQSLSATVYVSTLNKPSVWLMPIDGSSMFGMSFQPDQRFFNLNNIKIKMTGSSGGVVVRFDLYKIDNNALPIGNPLASLGTVNFSGDSEEEYTLTPQTSVILEPSQWYSLIVTKVSGELGYWNAALNTAGTDTPPSELPSGQVWTILVGIPISEDGGATWSIFPTPDTFGTGEALRLKGAIDATPIATYSRVENKHNDRWMQALDSADAWNVRTRETTATGDRTRWSLVGAEDNYFRLENKQNGRWLQALDSADAWNVRTRETTATGDRTKWRFIDAGGNYSRIQDKQNGRWLQALDSADAWNVRTRETTATGDRTKWRLLNAD